MIGFQIRNCLNSGQSVGLTVALIYTVVPMKLRNAIDWPSKERVECGTLRISISVVF